MQMSRSTVRQALDDMERDGIIHRVGRKGTFVSECRSTEVARSAAMAIVVLDVASDYYLSLLSGFEAGCAQRGYPALVCNTGCSIDRQGNHLMGLLAHRVSGVVLNPSSASATPPHHVELLQEAGIPVVLLHRPIPDVGAPLLEMPVEEIGARAARMLIEAGHRQVALLGSYRCDLSVRIENSFRQTLAEAGLELPDNCIDYLQGGPWADLSALDEYDRHLESKLPQLLAQPDRPTAIFAGFDCVAEHIYLAAQRMGVDIPGDLSLVSIVGAHRKGAILKRLTAIAVDEVAAGNKAVELLEEMRAGRRRIDDGEVIRLPLSTYKGETLGTPPAAASHIGT
jgi:LacI family transcriptional regulator